MTRLIVSLCCLLVVLTPVFCQEQVTREIPLKYASATEVAAQFSTQPVPKPCATDFGAFIKRSLSAAFADFPQNAWTWQSSLETRSELRAGLQAGGLAAMLPADMAGPPTAVAERNALRVRGTADALARLSEIVGLLDKPAPQVAVQMDYLGFPGANLLKLPGVSWTATDEAGRARNPWFAKGDFTQLLQDRRAVGSRLSLDVTVRNNRPVEFQLGEVLPHYQVGEAGADPSPQGWGRFVRLSVVPRVNADKTVTVLVEGEFLSGPTADTDTATFGPQPARLPVEAQVRVVAGETALIALTQTWGYGYVEFSHEHAQFGPQHLAQAVVAITPRPLDPEQPFTPDLPQLSADLRNHLLDVIFAEAIGNHCDGLMLGMNDQGQAAVWFRTGPEQWEVALLLPSYALGSLLHALGDPAGEGSSYKREDPIGVTLDLTVERTTIQGQPALVLSWPRQ